MTRFLLAVLALTSFASTHASAQSAPPAAQSAPPAAPIVTGRLFSPVSTVSHGPSVPVGLQITLPEGWHTYWRSPGIAGAPPQLDWTGSDNFASGEIVWPAPQRFSTEGIETFGYEGQFVLPIMVQLTTAGAPAALRLAVTLVVCREICVPAHIDAALQIPSGEVAQTDDAAAYQAAFRRVPQPAGDQGIMIDSLKLTKTVDGIEALQISATRTDAWQTPDVIVEAKDESIGTIDFKHPVTQVNGTKAIFTVPLDDPANAALLRGKQVTLTFIDGDLTADAQPTISAVDAAPQAQANTQPPPLPNEMPDQVGTPRTLVTYILLALLGGLILNLMPCVLPVLSLKLVSVVSHAGETRARIRKGFLATSLGILVSFLILAGVTIALQKSGGALAHYAGWGVQFQQPLFLGFLLAVVLVFTANLYGWFEIVLHGAVQNKFGGPQLPTDDNGPSLLSEFLSGLLATLLATPCTAPFVGSAVGFALGTGPLGILAIFVALGIGLAAPYLLIALFPDLARLLPRPGRWMHKLRLILGTLLLLTGGWLLGLLVIQLGWQSGLVLLALSILLLLILRRRQFLIAGLLALLLIAAAGYLQPKPMLMEQPRDAFDLPWHAFEPDKIPALIADGQTVFVDLTASWCLTCHVNETLVLHAGEVRAALMSSDVYLMRGDWTRPDPLIGDYLKAHGRAGVPFNMVVSPGAPEGVILPELLTKASITDAIGRTED